MFSQCCRCVCLLTSQCPFSLLLSFMVSKRLSIFEINSSEVFSFRSPQASHLEASKLQSATQNKVTWRNVSLKGTFDKFQRLVQLKTHLGTKATDHCRTRDWPCWSCGLPHISRPPFCQVWPLKMYLIGNFSIQLFSLDVTDNFWR